MENNIGVGIVIGIIITIGTLVYNSEKFTITQKYILLPSLLFLPLGIVLIIAALIYNEVKIRKGSSINIKQKVYNSNRNSSYATNDIPTSTSGTRQESEFEVRESIEIIDKKIRLVKNAFNQQLLNQREYDIKKQNLDEQKDKLSTLLKKILLAERIVKDNHAVFDKLKELKKEGLISETEYIKKRQELIYSINEKKELENKKLSDEKSRIKREQEKSDFAKREQKTPNHNSKNNILSKYSLEITAGILMIIAIIIYMFTLANN